LQAEWYRQNRLSAFGWRSIFLINLPLGLIVLIGLFMLMPNRKPNRTPTIDFAGTILLAISVTGIVLWSDSSQIFGSMTAPGSFTVLAISCVCILLWIRVERHAREPIIPLLLLANPTVALLIAISITSGAVAIGMVNYFALFLQSVFGLAPASAGLFFIPVTTGIVVGSLTSGRLMSASGRYKPYAILGLSLSTFCFIMLSVFGRSETPLFFVAVLMGLQGIGIGLGQQVPVLGVQNAARGGDIGAATGTVTLSRMIGAATAISIYGALLGKSLDAAGSIPGVGPVSDLKPVALGQLGESAHAIAVSAYESAFANVFFFAALTAGLGLVAALVVKSSELGYSQAKSGKAGA